MRFILLLVLVGLCAAWSYVKDIDCVVSPPPNAEIPGMYATFLIDKTMNADFSELKEYVHNTQQKWIDEYRNRCSEDVSDVANRHMRRLMGDLKDEMAAQTVEELHLAAHSFAQHYFHRMYDEFCASNDCCVLY